LKHCRGNDVKPEALNPSDPDICIHCGEPITDEDVAIVMNDGAVRIHRECMIRSIAGSVGHQLKRCTCYGGTEEDPPGMTRRQAARAAAALFAIHHIDQIVPTSFGGH
jgi:hypothetical protein